MVRFGYQKGVWINGGTGLSRKKATASALPVPAMALGCHSGIMRRQ